MMETEVIDHVNAAGDRCRTYIHREHGKVVDARTLVVDPFQVFPPAYALVGCNRRTAARDRRAPMFYKDVACALTALEELPFRLRTDCVQTVMSELGSHLRKSGKCTLNRTYTRRKCDR